MYILYMVYNSKQFTYLNVIKEKMGICHVEYHFFHSKSQLYNILSILENTAITKTIIQYVIAGLYYTSYFTLWN